MTKENGNYNTMSPNVLLFYNLKCTNINPIPKIFLWFYPTLFFLSWVAKKWLFPTKAAMSCTQCVLDSSPKDCSQ